MTFNDDCDLWKDVTQGVIPLQKQARDTSRTVKKLSVTPKVCAQSVYTGQKLKNLAIGNMADIDAATARRFRKGEYKVQAELDLHGCTEKQAYEKVIDFIKNAYLRQLRCVSIITGKGLHVKDDDLIFKSRGVLKERVPQWLNLPEIRPLILAIDNPPAENGGSGVIKLLLRRKRS